MRIAIVFTVLIAAASVVIAQGIGDTVVVVNEDGAELMIDGDVLHKLPRGNLLRIENSNENSYFTTWEQTGGWIKKGDVLPLDAALKFFTDAIAEKPVADDYCVRGSIQWAKGKYDLAIADLNEAIRRAPGRPDFRLVRGNVWDGKGEYDKAIADYSEAIRFNPQYALAFFNRGGQYLRKKEYDEAISDFDTAIRLLHELYSVAVANVYCNRGIAWHGKGEYDKAIADFDTAIRLGGPANCLVGMYNKRAKAWSGKGEHGKARADYLRAMRLAPSDAINYNFFAWFLATCPDKTFRDGNAAVEHATKACELNDWKHAYDLDTLAAAYAEAGNFDKSVEWQQKALDMVDEGEKDSYRSRLDLYKAGKPYREELKK